VRRVSWRLAAAAALLAICACSPQPRLPIALPRTDGQPPVRPSAPPPAPAPAADSCGARPLQSLIGRPRTEIPVPIHPERQRVMCTTCPMTMDYNAGRLNFLSAFFSGSARSVPSP